MGSINAASKFERCIGFAKGAYQKISKVLGHRKISLETTKKKVLLLLNNILTKEAEARGSRSVVPQKDTENSMKGACELHMSLRKW